MTSRRVLSPTNGLLPRFGQERPKLDAQPERVAHGPYGSLLDGNMTIARAGSRGATANSNRGADLSEQMAVHGSVSAQGLKRKLRSLLGAEPSVELETLEHPKKWVR